MAAKNRSMQGFFREKNLKGERFHLKYPAAHTIHAGWFGPEIYPPLCWRNASSPFIREVSIG
jgi:hypothetical protein